MSYVLTAFGPASQLNGFLAAAQGSGFIDWNPNWVQRAQDWAYQVMACGGTTRDCAELAAKSLRDKCRALHDAMRTAAADDPGRAALDLNALVPVPDEIRRAGYCPRGHVWCRENWGTAYPLTHVAFEMATQRLAGARIRQIARFSFDAEAPIWPVVRQVMRNWPALTVKIEESAGGSADESGRRLIASEIARERQGRGRKPVRKKPAAARPRLRIEASGAQQAPAPVSAAVALAS